MTTNARIGLLFLLAACSRNVGGSSNEDRLARPLAMPTAVIRIELPTKLAYKTGGALAVAQRGADQVLRVAVATDGGVAKADVVGTSATASLVPGTVSPRGHGALLREDGDELHLTSLDGADVLLPSKIVSSELASWALVSSAAVVMSGGWPALHFVKDGAIVWSVGTGTDGSAFVTGYDVSSNKDAVYVAVTAPDRKRGFITARALDGNELWRRDLPVPLGTVVGSDRGELAVLSAAPSRCETCMDAIVLDAATGKIRRSVKMLLDTAPFSLDGRSDMSESAGFAGGLAWFHAWRRERSDHMMGSKLEEACWYAVYDTNRRDPALVSHSLACARSMIPLNDGGVVTVDMAGDTAININVYDGPP